MKINYMYICMVNMLNFSTAAGQQLIRPIEENDILQATMIIQRAYEEFKMPYKMADLSNIGTVYIQNNGIFLVMLHNHIVIGTGALQKIDNEICELRRMYFSPEYRGQGLGSKMLIEVLKYAKKLGYKKIRLDIYDPITQPSAVKLYKNLVFMRLALINKIFQKCIWRQF